MGEKITLSGVPETMLQTIYARAKESRTRGAIHDEKAEAIIGGLDYDFSLAEKDAAMHDGVIARTIVLDRLTADWLAKAPGAVVVNIACGLDTRCYRMNGYAHWYNLDLPETIEVRKKLLPEDGAISQIAMSAMDDWGGAVAEKDTPALVIIEGLTMYLCEADVKRIFDVIARRFGKVTIFVEIMNPAMAKHFKEKSIEGSRAKFTWGIKNGKALSGIPEHFSGKLLEVPVGTGVLTMPVYRTMPEADITCLDYSPDMMKQAEEKADRMGLKNVTFRQGDVGALPYEDGTFDIVLSLNGFHAFPDKEAAYREVFRVLGLGGTFCGCFYVQGEHKRTDWFIRHVYEKAGFFTPPYETMPGLKTRLENTYEDVCAGNLKSIAWFYCRKAK